MLQARLEEKINTALCPQESVPSFSHDSAPPPGKMFSKTLKGWLVYTHKFNESYFFDLSDLPILHVIFSPKKWWELAGGKEIVQLNQKDIYHLCMKIDFFQVHGKLSWWFCRMFNKTSHREKVIETVTRFSIFLSNFVFLAKHSMGWSLLYLKYHSVPVFFNCIVTYRWFELIYTYFCPPKQIKRNSGEKLG